MVQNLLSILKREERISVERALSYLGSDRNVEAVEYCNLRLSQSPSPFETSFLNYVIGTSYLKQMNDQQLLDVMDIDKSVTHLRESLVALDYPDAHLMLGYALEQKAIWYLSLPKRDLDEQEAIGVVEESIYEFNKAKKLNPNYCEKIKDDISWLRRIRNNLNRKIRKKIALSN